MTEQNKLKAPTAKIAKSLGSEMKDLTEIHAEQIAAEAARRTANVNADQTNGITLLPCPFCGGEAYVTQGAGKYKGKGHSAFCPTCWAQIHYQGFTEAEAIAAWNTRAERTCHEVTRNGIPFCSECDGVLVRNCEHELADKYCPNCGAKVVE